MTWTTTRTRALAIPAVVGLSWAMAAVGSATAVTAISEVGWWSRNPLSSAPDGGFTAGAAPDGVTAVAAMRIDLGGGVDTLVLEVQPTADAISLASLEVCTTPDTWTAVANGPLDDAPLTACAGDTVPFAPAGEGWRADVSSLVAGASGVISLGVVPTPGSGTVPFEVTFEPPAARSTGAASPAPTSPSPPTASPGPTPTPSGSPSADPAPPPSIRVGIGSAPAPIAPAAPRAPAAPATPAAPPPSTPDDDGAASTIELATSGLLGDAGEAGPPRWGEALVLVLIGFGVGAAVYAVSRVSAARAARSTTMAST